VLERGDGKRSDTIISFNMQVINVPLSFGPLMLHATEHTFSFRILRACVSSNCRSAMCVVMQSSRKDGPQLIDAFVDTAYEYYKVLL
jgi:hypothetical protein